MDLWTHQLILVFISLMAILTCCLTYCICKMCSARPNNGHQWKFPRDALVVNYPLGGVMEHLHCNTFVLTAGEEGISSDHQNLHHELVPPPTYQSLFDFESEKAKALK